MEAQKQRYCRKCLLREMDEAEYFRNMYEYIRNLPKEDKASEEVYEERLARCKACGHLMNGMCRLCGCYVEMRAAMKIRACPDLEPKW